MTRHMTAPAPGPIHEQAPEQEQEQAQEQGQAQELETWLPVSRCMVRVSRRGSGNRPALEVFARGELIGVTVAGVFRSGACEVSAIAGTARGRLAGGQAWALAWGCVSGGRVPPALVFGPPGLRGRRVRYVEPAVIAGTFWVAEAAGRFRSVAMSGHRAVRLTQ